MSLMQGQFNFVSVSGRCLTNNLGKLGPRPQGKEANSIKPWCLKGFFLPRSSKQLLCWIWHYPPKNSGEVETQQEEFWYPFLKDGTLRSRESKRSQGYFECNASFNPSLRAVTTQLENHFSAVYPGILETTHLPSIHDSLRSRQIKDADNGKMNQIHSGPRLMVYRDEPKKISPKHFLDREWKQIWWGKEGGGHLTARVRARLRTCPLSWA